MVKKGNVPIPNNHFRKHWHPCSSQRGHVKNHFDQGPQKKRRRIRRLQRAVRVFPRPIHDLRPVVRCPTQRYNMRCRPGKGFTVSELKKAGINRRYARTIGIAVDLRRKNRCQESLDLNVNRLKAYLSKLVLYPKNPRKPWKGDSSPEQIAAVTTQSRKKVGPLTNPRHVVPKNAFETPRKLTEQEKHRHIFYFLRKVQRDQKLIGIRVKRQKKREEKAAKEKEKA
jgi:large subunit ribosomal protein L13e